MTDYRDRNHAKILARADKILREPHTPSPPLEVKVTIERDKGRFLGAPKVVLWTIMLNAWAWLLVYGVVGLRTGQHIPSLIGLMVIGFTSAPILVLLTVIWWRLFWWVNGCAALIGLMLGIAALVGVILAPSINGVPRYPLGF